MSRMNQWFLVGDGIAKEVIMADLQRYLGPDALVRPGTGTGEYEGRPGYWFTSYRTLTSQMIQDMKMDSQMWQREKYSDRSVHEGLPMIAYQDSRTHAARQYYGSSEPNMPGNLPSDGSYVDTEASVEDYSKGSVLPAESPSLAFAVSNEPYSPAAQMVGTHGQSRMSTHEYTDMRNHDQTHMQYNDQIQMRYNEPAHMRNVSTRPQLQTYASPSHRYTHGSMKFHAPRTTPSKDIQQRPPTLYSPDRTYTLSGGESLHQPSNQKDLLLGATSLVALTAIVKPVASLWTRFSSSRSNESGNTEKERLPRRSSPSIKFLERTAEEIARDCQWRVNQDRFPTEPIHTLLDSICVLGRGSAGEVDEARVIVHKWSQPPQSFARKRIIIACKTKRSKEQELETFRREVENLRKVPHPHVVKAIGSYLEVNQNQGLFAYILTYPVGEDLSNFLHAYKPRQIKGEIMQSRQLWVKNWFACLASALECMHQNGVQHKDIKPRNIIRRDEHIFFTDFSSSRDFDAGHTSTCTPATATRLYWAPEHSDTSEESRKERHGNESDVFALGLVFVELLTVLVGRDVDSLQEHVDGHNGFGDNNYFREYWRVVSMFDGWFAGSPDEGGSMYKHCIKPMLAAERKQRPLASEVRKRILERQPWNMSSKCPCLKIAL